MTDDLPPGLHRREDGSECGYIALGDPPSFCTKCGWTPLRQERDDLRQALKDVYAEVNVTGGGDREQYLTYLNHAAERIREAFASGDREGGSE